MSDTEHVLAFGDATLASIVDLVSPLIPATPTPTQSGFAFLGVWYIADADLDGIHLLDDRGLPLSAYRFDIASRAKDKTEWARRVFDLLARETNLDLLWVTNYETVQDRRPSQALVVSPPRVGAALV
ncbi:MAG: hypothetical protein LBN10_05945 [Propionibacteriaceae bacterium]|jgi:hypothetical protein|nr:hypothetical protein [Propionibacteriaceae bacterium]